MSGERTYYSRQLYLLCSFQYQFSFRLNSYLAQLILSRPEFSYTRSQVIKAYLVCIESI